MNSLHRLLHCEIGGLESCYYNRVSIIYTCNTYFVMHWSM